MAESAPSCPSRAHQGCFPLFDSGGRDLPGLPEPEQVTAVRTKLLDLGGPTDIDIVLRGVSGLVTATSFLRVSRPSNKPV